ncbi:patatin-like phospholipase [Pochonia chlamydosporia 170]|uniref:Patatin-like phospholipase n=1 Tax=Pochonia chlamydosporia 170 TaxID=1380566 RepID=A0A179F458_METCM|nr:patatin-like phospholipase [Pochonia chlamydosporia 170]OAQ60196.1 patatin-like phospholipase [Pochonia chlamydosporia 170]
MAKKCAHWLWYRGGRHPTISMSARLGEVTSSLSGVENCPSLVTVVGCRQLPDFFEKPKRQSGQFCLNLSEGSPEPLLVATSSLYKQHGNKLSCCIAERECQLSAGKAGPEVQNNVFSDLLYPFSDVFCFVSYSNDDLRNIAHQIARWTKQCNTDIRKKFLPRLVVVLDGSHLLETLAETVAEKLLNRIVTDSGSHDLSHYFSTLCVVKMNKGHTFAALQPILSREAAAVREGRCQFRQLFSVQHLKCLIDRAFDAMGNIEISFDPIVASRQDFPVNPDLALHIQNFVERLTSPRDLLDFAVETIASSILLNHYPPGMHCTYNTFTLVLAPLISQIVFHPAEVFCKLYEQACLEAGRRAFQLDLAGGVLHPRAFTDQISKHFEQFFQRLVFEKSAVKVHLSTLQKHSERWADIRSNKTCLACLAKHPQYKSLCGHWLCENCLLIFGKSDKSDPWLLVLEDCILCGKDAALYVKVRPPTAGHSILCIDGGGGRGIIPITILCMIEEALDLDIPIQEFFTHVYGSSAGLSSVSELRATLATDMSSLGALVLLTLYMEGWSARRCAAEFESLALEAFRPRVESTVSLQHVHGHQKLTDPSHAHTIGAKIGVLTANTDQPTIHLFNNYNGHGEERAGYCAMEGYRYFPAKRIETLAADAAGRDSGGIGKVFCDAGVIQNNPIFLARTEFAALNGDDEPDFILSGGTGYSAPAAKIEKKKGPKWLVCLYDALMSCMDGKRDWDKYMGCQKQSSVDRNYRLDVELPETTGLDDVTAIPALKALVYNDKKLNKLVKEVLVSVLFPTLFYLDLEVPPTRAGSKFNVHAHIFCVRAVDDKSYRKVSQRFRNSIILVNGKHTPSTFETDECGRVRRSLSFYTGDLLQIELRAPGVKSAFPISGSPTSLSKLVVRSGWSAYFGQSTHKRRETPDICNRPRQRPNLYHLLCPVNAGDKTGVSSPTTLEQTGLCSQGRVAGCWLT